MGQEASCCSCQNASTEAASKGVAEITIEEHMVSEFWFENFDNQVRWEMDAHGNKFSLLTRGFASETEENMLKFPMYGISMETLMQLNVMNSHEEMKRQFKLRKIPKTAIVHFVSHQWVGNTAPDPGGVQISRLQYIFGRILDGHARELFSDDDWLTYTKGFLKSDSQVSQDLAKQTCSLGRTNRSSHYTDEDHARELLNDVKDSYVWLDYSSIPQAVEIEGVIAEQISAVHSIPAYAERANYFWILAPSEFHADTGVMLNFQTWSTRGWCRLEEWSNFFSANAKMPLIITDSKQLSTKSATDTMILNTIPGRGSPFAGDYSCCRLNHQVKIPTGEMKAIPCDKPTVAMVMKCLWNSRLRQLERTPAKTKALMKAIHVCTALAAFENTQFYSEFQARANDTEEDFMSRMRSPGEPFVAETFGFGEGGPPWFAAMSRDSDFFAQYVAKHPHCLELPCGGGETALFALSRFHSDVLKQFLRAVPDLAKSIHISSPNGRTALDKAAWCGHDDTVELLLRIRADFNTLRTDTGRTPLLTAAAQGFPGVCDTLIKWRANPMTRETKSGRTALHIAAACHTILAGSQDAEAMLRVAETFLNARADISATDYDGMTSVQLAAKNNNQSMMEYLHTFAQDDASKYSL